MPGIRVDCTGSWVVFCTCSEGEARRGHVIACRYATFCFFAGVAFTALLDKMVHLLASLSDNSGHSHGHTIIQFPADAEGGACTTDACDGCEKSAPRSAAVLMFPNLGASAPEYPGNHVHSTFIPGTLV